MPLVNRTFDQLINFTRTTAATFVGSNGLIQTTPQSRNLLTFTEEFDNAAWTKSNVTITANSTTAPDGTMTADTATATASASVALNQSAVVSATAATFSIYAKQGNSATAANTFRLRNTTTATTLVEITLNYSTGAIAYTVGSTGASAVNVGNGWWRIAITATSGITSGNTLRVDAGFAGTGATNDFCFLWGAQLEAGSTATDYTRNFGGLFPPRLDYDPVTLAPRGLLIEEQRTNLLLRSEDFTTSWSTTGATITANATTSPDGATTADALVEDASTGLHLTQQFFTFLNATAYTLSIFVRPSTRTWVQVLLPASAFGASQGGFFDLTGAGALGNVTGTPTSRTITAVGGGWYRLTVTATSTAAAGGNIAVVAASANGTTSYTGNSSTAFFLWGAQLEAGAFATSYIPTVASQVTRTADIAAIAAPNFASWFNAADGSFLFEGNSAYGAGGMVGSTPTTGAIMYGNGNSVRTFNGTNFVGTANTYTNNAVFKAAVAYSASGRAVVLNGGTVATDANLIQTPTAVNLGSAFGGGFLNGHIRSIRYYPTRLSNAQLQALTA